MHLIVEQAQPNAKLFGVDGATLAALLHQQVIELLALQLGFWPTVSAPNLFSTRIEYRLSFDCSIQNIFGLVTFFHAELFFPLGIKYARRAAIGIVLVALLLAMHRVAHAQPAQASRTMRDQSSRPLKLV